MHCIYINLYPFVNINNIQFLAEKKTCNVNYYNNNNNTTKTTSENTNASNSSHSNNADNTNPQLRRPHDNEGYHIAIN